jgi:hypothetical protein
VMVAGRTSKNQQKYKQLVLVCGKNRPRLSAKENGVLYWCFSRPCMEYFNKY